MSMIATILVALIVALGQPAAKPNFSGEWKMNPAKSNFGPVPAPTANTRSITHAEPAITIVEDQKSPMGDATMTRKYVTDGSDMTFQVNGADVKGSAKWVDSALLMVSQVDAIGMTFNDTMTLSADGKTLTSVVRITSPQGEVEITVVFEKQ